MIQSMNARKPFIAFAVGSVLLLGACGGGTNDASTDDERSGPASRQCDVPMDLTRLQETPIGVLMPAGSLQRQSYKEAQEIASAGLNAVSLGLGFYYTQQGDITFDFDGNSDEDALKRWKNNLRCNVVEAKSAGLIVAVWGQFIEAGRRGEPGAVSEEIQVKILDQTLGLIPEVASMLEELKVEFWSPVSELDRFVGPTNHNIYFPQMVAAGRPLFTGTMYAQPAILDRNGFVPQDIIPDLGGVDALGISWISYECEVDKLPPGQSLDWADYFIDAAAQQGISRVYISELGDTVAADEGSRPCLEKLIATWNGKNEGVFLLDMPSDFPNGVVIKGSWQEQVLRTLRD